MKNFCPTHGFNRFQSNFFMKKIGILGGMGPESTIQFYQYLVNECQTRFHAQKDDDYPEIFIYNLPIPNVVQSFQEPQKIINMLQAGVQLLEKVGSDFIVIPCNTVHYFYDSMQQAVKIPIINIVTQTVVQIKSKNISCAGLLATSTTVQMKLYQSALEKNNIAYIIPENQEEVTAIIENILAGKKLDEDKRKLKKTIQSMQEKGAQAVILGCTDLPLLLTSDDTKMPLFDSLKILARATIDFAVEKK